MDIKKIREATVARLSRVAVDVLAHAGVHKLSADPEALNKLLEKSLPGVGKELPTGKWYFSTGWLRTGATRVVLLLERASVAAESVHKAVTSATKHVRDVVSVADKRSILTQIDKQAREGSSTVTRQVFNKQLGWLSLRSSMANFKPAQQRFNPETATTGEIVDYLLTNSNLAPGLLEVSSDGWAEAFKALWRKLSKRPVEDLDVEAVRAKFIIATRPNAAYQ